MQYRYLMAFRTILLPQGSSGFLARAWHGRCKRVLPLRAISRPSSQQSKSYTSVAGAAVTTHNARESAMMMRAHVLALGHVALWHVGLPWPASFGTEECACSGRAVAPTLRAALQR